LQGAYYHIKSPDGTTVELIRVEVTDSDKSSSLPWFRLNYEYKIDLSLVLPQNTAELMFNNKLRFNIKHLMFNIVLHIAVCGATLNIKSVILLYHNLNLNIF